MVRQTLHSIAHEQPLDDEVPSCFSPLDCFTSSVSCRSLLEEMDEGIPSPVTRKTKMDYSQERISGRRHCDGGGQNSPSWVLEPWKNNRSPTRFQRFGEDSENYHEDWCVREASNQALSASRRSRKDDQSHQPEMSNTHS